MSRGDIQAAVLGMLAGSHNGLTSAELTVLVAGDSPERRQQSVNWALRGLARKGLAARSDRRLPAGGGPAWGLRRPHGYLWRITAAGMEAAAVGTTVPDGIGGGAG